MGKNISKKENNKATKQSAPSSEEWTILLDRFDKLQAELEETKSHFLRSRADLDNYRKRMLKEKEQIRTNAVVSFFEELLPIIDHFNMGLKLAKESKDDAANIVEGFEMIYAQFEQFLKNHSIQSIMPEGQPFDPVYHESVSASYDENVPEGSVSKVIREGYRFKDRLIRPASVVVSSGKPVTKSEDTHSSENKKDNNE